MGNKYYTATILDKLPKECFENNVVHRMLNTMENKYYTPSIEEFHVGFEFEIHLMSVGGLVILDGATKEVHRLSEADIKVWEPTIYNNDVIFGRPLSEIQELISNSQIRVKYLDKEDIESLGFDKTFKNEFGLEYLFYENKDYQYCLYQTLNEVIIFRADKNVSWFSRPSFSDAYKTVFSGTIKNKSELKRVLKQVGVL